METNFNGKTTSEYELLAFAEQIQFPLMVSYASR
jgi:hypothetical protein